MKKKCMSILFACLLGISANAEVKPADIFTDNMVLQANSKVIVWGTAALAETVTVEINNVRTETRAGIDQQWRVELPPMEYGGPYELTVSGDNTVTFSNVMVGEVWLCAGQSNMRFAVRGALNAKQEIDDANFKNIRFFSVPLSGSNEPQFNVNTSWEICTPESVASKTATGYFFGRELHRQMDVAIGLIDVSYGGATIFTFMDKATFERTVNTELIRSGEKAVYLNYEKAVKKWENNNREGVRPKYTPQRFSSHCYNAMVSPVIPYANRGAIWYQGESNAGNPGEYVEWFGDYIEMMRTKFEKPAMPFYFVQLAGFENQHNTNIQPEIWAKFRLGQEQCLKSPYTGMVTAIDIGDKTNIHPKNKQEVGRRLALCALNKTYKKDVVCDGPSLASIIQVKKKVILTFNQCAEGLKTRDHTKEVEGFSALLNDGTQVELKGRITSKNTIQLKGENIQYLRYAYANYPVCNLYNSENLPALPFSDELKTNQ